MGTMWLHWSIHPFPLSPFPGAALCRLESKGNISVVASGCSWLPPFPWILGALGYWELLHRWGFPSCSQRPAFSSPSLQALPAGVWASSTGSSPGSNLEELLSLHVCSCVTFAVLCLRFVVC